MIHVTQHTHTKTHLYYVQVSVCVCVLFMRTVQYKLSLVTHSHTQRRDISRSHRGFCSSSYCLGIHDAFWHCCPAMGDVVIRQWHARLSFTWGGHHIHLVTLFALGWRNRNCGYAKSKVYIPDIKRCRVLIVRYLAPACAFAHLTQPACTL